MSSVYKCDSCGKMVDPAMNERLFSAEVRTKNGMFWSAYFSVEICEDCMKKRLGDVFPRFFKSEEDKA